MWWFSAARFLKRDLKRERQRGAAKKILSTIIEIRKKKKREENGREGKEEEKNEVRKNADVDRLARLDGETRTHVRVAFFPLPS